MRWLMLTCTPYFPCHYGYEIIGFCIIWNDWWLWLILTRTSTVSLSMIVKFIMLLLTFYISSITYSEYRHRMEFLLTRWHFGIDYESMIKLLVHCAYMLSLAHPLYFSCYNSTITGQKGNPNLSVEVQQTQNLELNPNFNKSESYTNVG